MMAMEKERKATVSQEQQNEEMAEESINKMASPVWTAVKLFAAVAFLYAALSKNIGNRAAAVGGNNGVESTTSFHGRRLEALGDVIPTYMANLMKDLADRKKLFEDTPPEEVKYWFEYAGPLQVSE